jgi:hypothetical protein
MSDVVVILNCRLFSIWWVTWRSFILIKTINNDIKVVVYIEKNRLMFRENTEGDVEK